MYSKNVMNLKYVLKLKNQIKSINKFKKNYTAF